MTSSLLVSILLHIFVVILFVLFPPLETPKRYKEILIDLAPEEPEPVPQDIQRPETPTPVPRERLVQPTPQPEPTPVQPDSLAAQATPAPTRANPTGSTSAVPPQISARPTAEDLLGDLQGIPTNRGAVLPSDLIALPNVDLSQSLIPLESDSESGRRFLEETRLSPLPEVNPTAISQSGRESADPAESDFVDRVRIQMQRMEAEFNETISSSFVADSSSSSQAIISDVQIDGELGRSQRRVLKSLDLSKFLDGTKDPDWPNEIPVQFEVNSSGFVQILNLHELALYTEIVDALFELFRGKVFVSVPGSRIMKGSITYKLQ